MLIKIVAMFTKPFNLLIRCYNTSKEGFPPSPSLARFCESRISSSENNLFLPSVNKEMDVSSRKVADALLFADSTVTRQRSQARCPSCQVGFGKEAETNPAEDLSIVTKQDF